MNAVLPNQILKETLARLAVHDHTALIYDTPAEKLTATVPFLKIGLERGERCLYIAAAATLAKTEAALGRAGIDVRAAAERGALQLAPPGAEDRPGSFEPDHFVSFLAESVTRAKTAGFTAFRFVGEMAQILDNSGDPADLFTYEAQLGELVAGNDLLVLCQYPRRLFAPELLLDLVYLHPWLISENTLCQNSLYVPPADLPHANRADRLLAHLRDGEKTRTALAESEERLRWLVENAPDVIYRYHFRPAPGLDYISPNVVIVTGYTAGEYYRNPNLFVSLLYPADRPLFEGLRHAGSPTYTPLVLRSFHRDGSTVWTDHRIVPTLDARGNPVSISGIARDITATRQAEQRERLAYDLGRRLGALLDLETLLAETVHRLSETFGYYHAHIYLCDDSCSVETGASEKKERRLVMRAGTGEAGQEMKHNQHTIPLLASQSLVARAARSLQPVVVNNVCAQPDYLPNPLLPDTQSEAAIPLFTGDQLLGVLDLQHTAPDHFGLDEIRTLQIVASQLSVALVNAQLFVENARSQAMYQELADSIADIFFAVDHELKYTYWNKASEKLTGIPAGEAIGQSLLDIFPDMRGTEIETLYHRALTTQQPQNLIHQLRVGPEEHFFEINVYPSAHGLSVYVRDITQRVRAEQVLQQRNRALDLLNRAGRVFISTHDLDQVLAVILEEIRHSLDVIACSAWLLDPATGELVCRQVTDPQSGLVRGWRLMPGQGLAGWVVDRGQSLTISDAKADERHFRGVDDQTGLELRSILTVPLHARHNIIGVLQVVDTMVDRFDEADQALLESLAATATIAIENARLYEQARQDAEIKSALLAEVNHRVKNNLAAIVGLLYAEKRHAGLENQSVYQSILNDLISRVQGLATVHSLLSASEWSPLRLSDVAQQVTQSSLQMLPRDHHVMINVPASPVKVTPDQAHNLALIINELVTNTVQHGMAGRSTARITFTIHQEKDTVQCEFRDDGPGYPAVILQSGQRGFNLGFELIQNLVQKSLRGQIALHNDQGAVVTIRFKSKLRN